MAGPTTFGLFGTLVSVDPRVDRPRRSTADESPDRGRGRPGANGAAGDRGVGPPPGDDWSPAAAVAEELAARGVEVPGDWTAAYAERHLDPPPLAGVPLPAHVAAALRSRGVEYADNAVRRAVVAAFDPEVAPLEGAAAAVETAAERGPVGVLTNCVVPELAGRTLLRAGLRDAVDVTDADASVTRVGGRFLDTRETPLPAAARMLANGGRGRDADDARDNNL